MRLLPQSTVAKRQISVLVATAIMIAVFSFLSPHFFTARNFLTILKNLPELGFISIGMSLVMITGGIDISAEAVLGIGAILIGKLLLGGSSAFPSAFAGVMACSLLGFINGSVIVYGKIVPIIATLGSMYIWRAAIFLLVGARWLAGIPHTFDPIVKRSVAEIPIPFLLLLGCTVALEFVFRKTSFGWHILAIGNSESSARLAGVNTRRTTLIAYTLLGFLVGVAAFLYVGRYRNVEMTIATGMSLEAIAATVIGGTSILGGEGTIIGCLLGVFFVRVIQNGLVLLHVPSLWDYLVLGTLILLALSFDLIRKRRT